jgi:2-succinyl-5-enolpyruvyl-6-hydroxy-3-cyclohexene-1-carboxylate synthase
LSPAPPPRADLAFANGRAALALLAALRRGGLRHLVLCPGSRSGPLAVAAALLEPAGLRLHTAIDERSAAFFALGLGRAEGLPAAVVTTSGSAVAHLLPAAVEADHGTVPLLLLSADRPSRLKGCGANQSVNQEQFLVCSCRWVSAGAGEGLASLPLEALQELAGTAMAHALGDGRGRPPGAVHLNLPFEEPLHAGAEALRELERIAAALSRQRAAPGTVPAAALAGPACAAAVADGLPPPAPPAGDLPLDPGRPGVVVAGPWRGPASAWEAHRRALLRWQGSSGWPVLADPLSGLRGDPELALIGAYDLLLADPPADLWPRTLQVLRLGSLPASRPLERWLAAAGGRQWLVSEADARRLDPLHRVAGQSAAGLAAWLEGLPPAVLAGPPPPTNTALALRWQRAEAAVQACLDEALAEGLPEVSGLSEPLLARQLSRLLPPGLPLLLANSSPVRDWAAFAHPEAPPRPLFGFRGASGIDGTLSIAAGLAEALGQAVLLCGDLALLHDSNGWLWRDQLRGRLTVLLIDNGGGGIFEQLPIRCPPPERLDFERLFAMPQGVDPLALAAAHGVPGRPVRHAVELAEALGWALEQPLALLRLITDRRADAMLRQRLRTMAARSLPLP